MLGYSLFVDDPAVEPDLLTIPMDLETGPVLYRAYIVGKNASRIDVEGPLGEIMAYHPGLGWTRKDDAESPIGSCWYREAEDGTEWAYIRRCGQ